MDVKEVQAMLEVRARQQEIVTRLGQQALAGIELTELFDRAATHVAQTLEVEYCKVLELLPAGDELILRAGTGWEPGHVGYSTVSASVETQAGYTLLSDEPIIIEDWLIETRFRRSRMLQEHEVRSGVSVVIAGEPKPFGILSADTSQKRRFTQDDIYFLQAVANVLAAAIDRKRTEEALQEHTTILHAIIEGTNDPIFVKDCQGRYIVINSAGARVAGRSVEEMIGRDDSQVLPSDLAQKVQIDDQQVITTGEPRIFETLVEAEDTPHVFQSFKTAYRDNNGEIIGVIGISRDITELKQAELSQRLLAEAGKALAASLDYEQRLSKVAWLAVPQLADWCSVDLIESDQSLRPVTIAHVDPAKVELAHELQRRYPPNWEDPGDMPPVLRTGRSELFSEITDAMLEAAARDAEHYRILRDLQMKSAMVVPLSTRGQVLGMMTFVWAESNRRYTEADLRLAEELARRAAMAIDNARLYQAERETRRTAQRTLKHLTSLQRITTALARALTPAQVSRVIIEQGIATLKADSGLIALLDETGEYLEILDWFGYKDEVVEPWQRFPLAEAVPLAEAARMGQAVFIDNPEMLQARYPEFAARRKSDYNIMVSLPLTVENRVVGAIGLSFANAGKFSQETRDFMMALARQCAQALERARLYEVEQQARVKAEAARHTEALLVETRERNRLAQELHDNVAQALGYLNLKIGMINMLLAEGKSADVEANLNELKQIVGETYTDVREEIFNLRSSASPGGEFLATLQDYIAKYKRFYDLEVRLIREADKRHFEFPNEVGIQLIRTIQEALMNVRKHAQVNEAIIRLEGDGQQVRLSIEDQGQGFDTTQRNQEDVSNFGLQIMHERIEKVGGSLEIKSTPGQGTQVILTYSPNEQSENNKEEKE